MRTCNRLLGIEAQLQRHRSRINRCDYVAQNEREGQNFPPVRGKISSVKVHYRKPIIVYSKTQVDLGRRVTVRKVNVYYAK